MANIDQKLDLWKNKLLDLGKRNRLLNYRDTKRSNLRIRLPEIFDLWESFVVNESSLEFDYCDDEKITPVDEKSESFGKLVVTNQTINEQQKTLRSLREKAKIAMDEQGVNILYLSFAFLKWSENGHSDQHYTSPLVLVPVTITLESITSPYILSLHEDEMVVNPTLAYKLDNDFGLTLPDFDSERSLDEYLNKVNGLVSKNKWKIAPDVCLSLLSFLKINMYNDLEIHKDRIKENPIIRALNGDVFALENTTEYINDFDHDKNTNPIDLYQVVDADSSQQDAILYAKKGASFVLQGPPGTGKSQTITNIISECLADGKKILFVSEKMAALEVVHKRLTSVGLSDFCLTLHNYKANKKEILGQLGSVLTLARQKTNLSDEAFQKLQLLQDDKEKLNEYAEAIFTRIAPLDKTIYEVNGYLAHLQSYEDIVFNIEDIAAVTQSKFNRYINLLNRFVDTIGEMSDDYKYNPWNGSNVQNVSNELRHDIGAYLIKLIPKIDNASKICEGIETKLQLDCDCSYFGLAEIVDILGVSCHSPKVPINWISSNDISSLFNEIEKYSKLKNNFKCIQKEVEIAYEEIMIHDKEIKLDSANDLLTTKRINMHLYALKQAVENNYCYSIWTKADNFGRITESFNIAREKITEYSSKKKTLLDLFEEEIFDIDYKAMYNRFKTDYTPVLKVFKSQYKADKKSIQKLYRKIVKKVSDESIVEILVMLRCADEAKQWMIDNDNTLSYYFGEYFKGENTDFEEVSKTIRAFDQIRCSFTLLDQLKTMAWELESKEAMLKNHYDFMYEGINTDWNTISESLNWANEFSKIVNKYKMNDEFIRNVCNSNEKIIACSEYKIILSECLNDMDIEFNWFLNLFDNKDEIKNTKMMNLSDRLNKCVNGLALLEEWIDFRNTRESCRKEDLEDYIEKIENIQIDMSFVIPIFKKRFYRLWLDAVLPQFPVVINFRRKVHENTIDEFAMLDKLQFQIAKARVRKKLIDELPSLDRFISGTDEMSILKRELGKQRKMMPIRKLFKEIPNLLLTLKPCLMMSPLSVSLFLEADSYKFDTIIFDEASQVCTENAIGAISRGKQVIIAGDSKQLPPTNFFATTTSDADFDTDNENEEYDDVDAYESILDEAGTLPERTLLWHYRSRHEHLIAFSNAKIYKNNLITFPSNVDKTKDNGVEYIYVKDGFYDRGGKNGNVVEANRVALLVFEHFKKFPDRSLGVIAFGEVQQQAIDAAIRKMRRENQQFEIFFKEDNVEAFFVKNLENVQGDERDTIIFSIGYAKDMAGKMQMNFGPLSKSGGERRLNVAITRAKFNVKLVGSIIPTDIQIDRISAEGPKLLRAYVDYAMNGTSVISREIAEQSIVEQDSPFESAVCNFLTIKGYKIDTQIGCSCYRIDMAVKHPTINGRYVLGIECDGQTYHSARTARERDRLRKSVLEDMGWKLYRIWSTDWIKDPITEGEKLIEVIEKSIKDCAENNLDVVNDEEIETSDEEIEAVDSLNVEKTETNIEKSETHDVLNVEKTETYDVVNDEEIETSDEEIEAVDSLDVEKTETYIEKSEIHDVLNVEKTETYDVVNDEEIETSDEETEAVDSLDVEKTETNIEKSETHDVLNVAKAETDGELLNIDMREVAITASPENPYDFEPYNQTDIDSIPRDEDDIIYLGNVVKAVVDNEYPIHYELLCKKLTCLFGREKVTAVVRNSIDHVLSNTLKDVVIKKDKFIYPQNYKTIVVKIPNTRAINHISIEELSEAMFTIASKCIGLTRESLCLETAKAYGFNRTGNNINNAMKKAFDVLLEGKRVKEMDNKIVLFK